MNKTELIKAVAEISGAKQTETGVFFENLIEVIESTYTIFSSTLYY
jgi:nucleoid DNA-binding protein